MFIFHIRKQVICNIRTFQIYSVPSFSHHSQTTFHLPLKAHKNIFTKIKIGPPDQLLICNARKNALPFPKTARFFNRMLVLFILQSSTVVLFLFSSEPPALLPDSRVRSVRIPILSPGSAELLLLLLLQRFP